MEAALWHARRGRPVFPCRENKQPAIPRAEGGRGLRDATTDQDQIRAWWGRWPRALVGMPTGAGVGVFVLDVDVRDGKLGEDSLAALVKEHGPLPDTVEAITASGGRHLYFRHPRGQVRVPNSASKLGADLDIRGDGGYVILPPSRTPAGQYQWEGSSDPDEGVRAASAPEWLLQMVIARPRAAPAEHEALPDASRDDVQQALQALDPDCDYETWTRIGMALQADGGDWGLSLWDAWSSQGSKYPGYGALAAKWASFTASGNETGQRAGLGSLFHLARAAGWTRPRRFNDGRQSPPRAASQGGEGQVVQGDFPGIDWQDRMLTTKEGGYKATAFNVRLILENDPAWRGVLSWCEFSHRIVTVGASPLRNASRGEWEDADDSELRFWLAERYGIEPRHTDIADGVLGAARSCPTHPVRAYLDALRWDGEHRLCEFLPRYLGAGEDSNVYGLCPVAEGGYLQLAGAMFLVSAVARVRRPGAKADHVLILEGRQGAGKSTALRVLFGAEWFTDSPLDLNSKDSMEGLRGLWGVELAELDALNKADAARAKAFFSRADDRFRLPYGHRSSRFDRQCVFAGSTNQVQYLKDTTGGRRFWPVQCGRIDLHALRTDRDQLWAEADALYRSGFHWWPHGRQVRLFDWVQDARLDADVWEPIIASYLADQVRMTAPASRPGFFVEGHTVMSAALGMDKHAMRRPEQTRLGQIMQSLGWLPSRPSVNGQRQRGYRPSSAYLRAFEEGSLR